MIQALFFNKISYLLFIFSLLFSNSVLAGTEFELYKQKYRAANKKSIEELYARRSHITGIELLIADSANDLESKWGHALLRFLGTGKFSFNDLTVSFGALIDETDFKGFNAPVGYVRGIFGKYEIVPGVQTIRDIWESNNLKQGRSIHRYIIPTSVEQRMKIVETLLSWVSDQESTDNPLRSYYFLSKNCGTLLMYLLEESGLAFPGSLGSGSNKDIAMSKWSLDTGIKGIVAPIDTPFLLQKELLTPFLAIQVPSVEKKLRDKGIKVDNKKFVNGQWSDDFVQTLISKNVDFATLSQISRIQNPPTKAMEELINHLRSQRNKSGELLNGQFFDFAELPQALYELCSDLSCGKQVQAASRKVWRWCQVVTYSNGESELACDDEWRLAFRERSELYLNYLQKYTDLGRVNDARSTPQARHFGMLLDTL